VNPARRCLDEWWRDFHGEEKNLSDTNVPYLTGTLEDSVRVVLDTHPAPAGVPSARKKKAAKVSRKSADLKTKFRAAHAKGMKALERHDYDALETVIHEEAQLIDAHSALITAHQLESAALSRRIAANLKRSMKATKSKRAVPK